MYHDKFRITPERRAFLNARDVQRLQRDVDRLKKEVEALATPQQVPDTKPVLTYITGDVKSSGCRLR